LSVGAQLIQLTLMRAELCRGTSRQSATDQTTHQAGYVRLYVDPARGAARRGPPVTLTVAKLRLALSTAQRAR